MSWPGQIPAGTRYSEPVVSFDLFATLVRAAGGASPATVEGVDLLPYLHDAAGTPHDYLFWGTQSTGAVRHGKWKLVDRALYDLSQDIGEEEDLAAANPDVVAEMRHAQEAWVRTLAPPLW
jgi:arylsulfatase A-like enzyme